MALHVIKSVGTTTDSNQKPRKCWTCLERKTGLFSLDSDRRERCADCCRAAGRPID